MSIKNPSSIQSSTECILSIFNAFTASISQLHCSIRVTEGGGVWVESNPSVGEKAFIIWTCNSIVLCQSSENCWDIRFNFHWSGVIADASVVHALWICDCENKFCYSELLLHTLPYVTEYTYILQVFSLASEIFSCATSELWLSWYDSWVHPIQWEQALNLRVFSHFLSPHQYIKRVWWDLVRSKHVTLLWLLSTKWPPVETTTAPWWTSWRWRAIYIFSEQWKKKLSLLDIIFPDKFRALVKNYKN